MKSKRITNTKTNEELAIQMWENFREGERLNFVIYPPWKELTEENKNVLRRGVTKIYETNQDESKSISWQIGDSFR